MPKTSAAVVDALQSLHEAEQGSVFRLMGDDSPYVSAASEDVRGPLRRLHDVNRRHVRELAEVIGRLGGAALAPPAPEPSVDESYLKYLSLKFLVPKLLREKELMLERYNNALRALPTAAPPEVAALLKRQQGEQQAHVEELEAAVAPGLAAAGERIQ